MHSTLHRLAWGCAGIFAAAFMLSRGIAIDAVLYIHAGIFLLRFVLRPFALALVTRIGVKRSLILGTVAQAAQFPILATIGELDHWLLAYAVVVSLANVIYFPCYHTVFAVVGDAEHRGSQVSIRQALSTVAGIVGPVAGGLALTYLGPWAAFSFAAALELAAIIPLLYVRVRIATPNRCASGGPRRPPAGYCLQAMAGSTQARPWPGASCCSSQCRAGSTRLAP